VQIRNPYLIGWCGRRMPGGAEREQVRERADRAVRDGARAHGSQTFVFVSQGTSPARGSPAGSSCRSSRAGRFGCDRLQSRCAGRHGIRQLGLLGLNGQPGSVTRVRTAVRSVRDSGGLRSQTGCGRATADVSRGTSRRCDSGSVPIVLGALPFDIDGPQRAGDRRRATTPTATGRADRTMPAVRSSPQPRTPARLPTRHPPRSGSARRAGRLDAERWWWTPRGVGRDVSLDARVILRRIAAPIRQHTAISSTSLRPDAPGCGRWCGASPELLVRAIGRPRHCQPFFAPVGLRGPPT